LADGIKIRELDPTSIVSGDDVFVLDKETLNDNSITYHIRYDSFRSQIFTGDVVLNGSLSVSNDLNVYGDTNISGNLSVTNDLTVGNININGSSNIALDDLTDVEVAGAANKHYLMYDGAKWVSNEVDLDDLGGGQSEDFILLAGGDDKDDVIVFTVTVGPKTTANQFYGIGSNECFYINGKESPVLMLPPNRTFVFDQSDNSNVLRRLTFFEEQSEGMLGPSVKPGIEYEGTPGAAGAKTKLTFTTLVDAFGLIDGQTPDKLFYRSSNGDQYMGGVVHNLGSSIDQDLFDGGDLFPFPMTVPEALRYLHQRLDSIEGSN